MQEEPCNSDTDTNNAVQMLLLLLQFKFNIQKYTGGDPIPLILMFLVSPGPEGGVDYPLYLRSSIVWGEVNSLVSNHFS